ncbi:ABC transporter permease subunit [Rhizobium sp. SG_E_25_P2]|uniref:ABC transporter permease subunit n=1 Tax=Rhizobium sp. SG_E_25_P2 TaxID=2879942 RepID=UPI002475C5A9|nr:ABC transporter permease subunit [Rhizobium sp. SG_E_25_P2]
MIRSREDRVWISAGFLSLAGILLFVALAVAALLAAAPEASYPPLPYLAHLTAFTLWQAFLSTLLSVAVAVPVALALARRGAFPGRGIVAALLVLPLGLPVLPAVFGLIEIWGRQGLANDILVWFGAPRLSIYGLAGILIAHVFFNLPLAVRFLLTGLDAVPRDEWRLAASLGFSRLSLFRFVEGPALLRALPGAAGLIFMLCMTSFTIILTLGGGPATSTLEVAIYQALKFDFDPARALALTLLQIALTGLVFQALRLAPDVEEAGSTLSSRPFRPDAVGLIATLSDGAIILLFTIFVAAPLAAATFAGLNADLLHLISDPLFHRALAISLGIAIAAGLFSTLLGYTLLEARRRFASGSLARRSLGLTDFILLLPPLALGAGWFVLQLRLVWLGAGAPFAVIVINALMAMPFVARALGPALDSHALRTERLALSLGVTGWNRLRLIDWPALKTPFLTALAFAMALSLGDLGAIALFGDQNFITLPALLYAKLGSYRGTDAAGLSLILGLVCLALMAPALRAYSSGGTSRA